METSDSTIDSTPNNTFKLGLKTLENLHKTWFINLTVQKSFLWYKRLKMHYQPQKDCREGRATLK